MGISRLFSRKPHRDALPSPRGSVLLQRRTGTGDALPTAPRAVRTAPHHAPWNPAGGTLQFPWGADPLLLFPFLRYLRDHIPDVSAGVWAWVRLCSTPQRVEYSGGTDAETAEARQIVEALDSRVYEFDHMKHQGMDALVNAFFLSVFTCGSFAGEVVLHPDRSGIRAFCFIDPATIRFRRDASGETLVPVQIAADGSETPLHPDSFFYYGLDTDCANPYGRSPLTAIPFVARIQQQLIEDMGRAMHNCGWPTLHVQYRPAEREPGESVRDYHTRIESDLRSIQETVPGKQADSNYITFDNVQIQYLSPGTGGEHRWNLSLQAIGEQVVSALHLAPFMIGRNWGTTETWGAAQYRLIVNSAVSVQRGAKRMAEWLRDLELAIRGSRVRTRHHFESHGALSSLDAARARNLDMQTALRLREENVLSAEELRGLVEKWL